MRKLDRLTRLRGEELSKKKAQEEKYRIEQIGQESEVKGAKLAREDLREREKQEQKFTEESFGKLELFRKRGKKYYNRFLRLLFRGFADEENIPSKYTIWTRADSKGLAVGIMGTNFYRAIKPSGIEKYDFMACKILAIQVGNTIAKLEGNVRTTEDGIVLPDEIDNKKYGRNS